MIMTPDINHVQSVRQFREKPALSILIPYFHDDPRPAIGDLQEQNVDPKDIEILVYDDGSGDADLNRKVCADVKQAVLPVHLHVAAQNRGRSFARNYLRQQARADWVLFLDADMRPESREFIADYLAEIQKGESDVIFGGFTVPASTEDPERELHRAFSMVSDCLSLEERRAKGPQYVCSSNLCVRGDVIDAEPFDPEFSGWGWEDSEWAARIAGRYQLIHIDNPALHLGLETTDTLLNRFKSSGPNYWRFTSKHPSLARTLKLYNVTRKLRRIPGQKLMRPFLKSFVKSNSLPVNMRLFALKLWRASWYAETRL